MKTKDVLTLIGLLLVSITLVPTVLAQASPPPTCTVDSNGDGALDTTYTATHFVDVDGDLWASPDGGITYVNQGPYTGEMTGTSENDVLILPSWPDTQTAIGQEGSDVICGSAGPDTILGGLGNDIIYGGDGDDIINSNQGHDIVYGEGGNDYLHGGVGDDSVFGGPGNDTIIGYVGVDALYGEDGDDYIFAGIGNDEINGGAGVDDCDLGANDPSWNDLIVHEAGTNPPVTDEHYYCESLATPLATTVSSLSTGDSRTALLGAILILVLGVGLSTLAIYKLQKLAH